MDSSRPPSSSPFRLRLCPFRLSPCLFLLSMLFFLLLLLQFDIVHLGLSDWLQRFRSLPVPSYSSVSPSTVSSPLPSPPPPPPPSSLSSDSHSTFGGAPASGGAAALTPIPPPPPNASSFSHTIQIGDPSSSSNLSANSSTLPRVAICLVGGAREFELTGPSIKKHLLLGVPQADVFVHAPLDKDSFKLSILKDIPNVVHFRVFKPEHILETSDFRDVLTASNSPQGIQGLLQYFNLVEGCVQMIQKHQSEHKFEYEWIIRTRLDGYWNGYFPPLDEFDRKAYTVPIGSQFGGLNDRLGIGNWQNSEVALSRLSFVSVIHAHNGRGLNSESYFKQQLKVRKVAYKFQNFPFCILSRRKYGWPPNRWGVPVASISSRGQLNGIKCRPCTVASGGDAAKSMLKGIDRGWGWPGTLEDIELCNPTGEWESHWQNIYDSVAGPESAKIRASLSNQNSSECIQGNEELKKNVQFWDAPTPEVICEKGMRF